MGRLMKHKKNWKALKIMSVCACSVYKYFFFSWQNRQQDKQYASPRYIYHSSRVT